MKIEHWFALIGVLLLLAGVALIYMPAALIVAGVILLWAYQGLVNGESNKHGGR